MQDVAIDILVIEDNTGDYTLVKEYLEEGMKKANIIHAETLQQGIESVEKEQVDIILLDLTLPDGMGIESFYTIYEKAPEVPIIILTGLEDTETALTSLHVGAQDYIVKDNASSTVLSKSIKYSIERNKMYQHLKRSEEQYKYLFNNNPLPMCGYDAKTHQIIMANDAAVAHYGYTEAELLNLKIDDLEATRKDINTIESSYSTGTDNTLEYDLKHRKKNGKVIDVEMVTHDIVISGISAILAVMHDVTERNKAREQLRESEQIFRTISENFPNGAVAILNRDLTILHIAGKEFHISNADAAYFINTKYTEHFYSPVKEAVHENLMKVFAGTSTVFEATYEDKTYMISAAPLYEAGGDIHKILIASQNITAQKKTEAEKEMLIEELTHNNSDLQQFSYITSHNLRSPLSNLIGIIKLIDKSTITDPMNNLLLQNFEDCTLQLNETVNDLISVLIIKNSVNALKEKLDIRVTFEKVVNSIYNLVEINNAEITSDMDDAYEVEFNRSYLESILLNLLTNAIKYKSPDRTPHIKISTEKTNDGVKLIFSDNGLGIDLERHRDRIFGLYQRFHNHEDSKGLGLYIVNSQVRVMGGEIDVESEVDKGTTFIINFKK